MDRLSKLRLKRRIEQRNRLDVIREQARQAVCQQIEEQVIELLLLGVTCFISAVHDED